MSGRDLQWTVMPARGEMVADRYRLETLIARGGVSEVYRAHDTTEGNAAVAIKLIPAVALATPAARQLFERTADLRLRVTHPSVVRVFDRGELPDGRGYVAMELVEGEDLRQRLARDGRLDQTVVVDILVSICGGLDAAHCAGIVHGDLKPENIMLPGAGGQPKIVDFVGARRMGPDGTIVGTPAYMAPEQLRGDPPGARSDVFSLGVLAFEMLMGRLPFGRGAAGEVLLRQALGVPQLSGTAARFGGVIRSALELDPDRRPPSARAFAQLVDSAR